MASEFDDRRVLVTGAASGIGRAVAVRFAALGARVVAFDIDPAGLAGLAGTCDLADVVVGDVRRPGDLASAVEVDVDIVAAIAGLTRVGPVHEMSVDDRDLVLDVNLGGVWNTIAAAVPGLLRRGDGGRIIVCGSIECTLGGAGLSAYVASKHAVLGLVKSVALELATTGITANVVSPAGVDTELLRSVVPPESIAHIAATTPISRLCTPDEIAAFFEFVASGATAYMTGENLIVDGGLKLVNAHTSGEAWAES